ncbi:hypothetical protein NED98_13070 [Sphingomonas sp. MMSM20]|uniref:hypothetical protein n=1 Tax=Sphingomonas lycopersici TaxID=2951807 RepID=UPI002237ED0C|nr:hypothetical protein [Sphingomonas lycopersici]MCW6531177.1 hypothetical protein [Sphingomonas lycopersici]
MNDGDWTDDLRRFLVLREGWEDIQHPVLRARKAYMLFKAAIRIARGLCGEAMLREVYGPSDDVDGRDRLLLIARRLEAAAWIFLPFHGQPVSLSAVADEAVAVANGDDPLIFARLGKLSKVRLLGEKLEALKWEAWLSGLGVSAADRQHAITTAYLGNGVWDSIRRRWGEDVNKHFGENRVADVLKRERRDGSRSLRRWVMRPDEHWEAALARSGNRYRRARGT